MICLCMNVRWDTDLVIQLWIRRSVPDVVLRPEPIKDTTGFVVEPTARVEGKTFFLPAMNRTNPVFRNFLDVKIIAMVRDNECLTC